jgi:N-acyl-L-homoserine lactone synthetase
MITCVTYENLHEYGGAFYAQFKLRHKAFIERQNYQVSTCRSMEYDQYDTPAALYLVYMDSSGEAKGCSRLTPVDRGCMLKDVWPSLVSCHDNIFARDVWEGTRFCIDKDLPIQDRKRILQELVLGYFEVGLNWGMKKIIGVMPPYIFRKVFGDCGCSYQFLGGKLKLPSGETIAAGTMDITEEALNIVRNKVGIYHAVLSPKNVNKDRAKIAA